MKQTFKEKIISWYLWKGRKSAACRWLLFPVLFFALLFIRFIDFFRYNVKKHTCLITLATFFIMSSSFSFPVFDPVDEMASRPTLMLVKSAEVAEEEGKEENADYEKEEVLINSEFGKAGDTVEQVDTYSGNEILDGNGGADVDESEAGYELTAKPAKVVDVDSLTFDKKDWKLTLVNKQHPIPEGYTFELGTIKDAMKCDKRVIPDLMGMLQGAQKDGVNLVICSPYRDMNRQVALFQSKVEKYMEDGMGYMEAYKSTAQAVTIPGSSEHQMGLAIDIVEEGYPYLNEGFANTKAGQWLAEHSVEYGFIVRYPKGKEYITSIEFEPWHFRYVGKEAAIYMKVKGLCLEEFVDTLQNAPDKNK